MAAINATRGLTQVLASDEDAAALNALVPAVVRPAASVNDALAALFDDDGTGLSFSAFKIAGLPETTFIWMCVVRSVVSRLMDQS